MLERFCPKCGSTEGPFVEGFCKNCYLQDHKMLEIPDKFEILFCKKCDRIKLKNVWLKYENTDAIAEYLLHKLKMEDLRKADFKIKFMPLKENYLSAKITVKGIFKGLPVLIEKDTEIKLSKTNCPDCSRIAGGYFEGILQVRSDNPNKIERAKRFVDLFLKRQKDDPLAKIIKRISLPNGFDYYVGSKRVVFQLARELKAEFEGRMGTSNTLMGLKEGQEIKRLTVCVRFDEEGKE